MSGGVVFGRMLELEAHLRCVRTVCMWCLPMIASADDTFGTLVRCTWLVAGHLVVVGLHRSVPYSLVCFSSLCTVTTDLYSCRPRRVRYKYSIPRVSSANAVATVLCHLITFEWFLHLTHYDAD